MRRQFRFVVGALVAAGVLAFASSAGAVTTVSYSVSGSGQSIPSCGGVDCGTPQMERPVPHSLPAQPCRAGRSR